MTCLYVGRDPAPLAPVKIMAECQHRTERCQGQRYFGEYDHMFFWWMATIGLVELRRQEYNKWWRLIVTCERKSKRNIRTVDTETRCADNME